MAGTVWAQRHQTRHSELSSTVRVQHGETLLLQLPATGADDVLDGWLADHAALETRYLRTPLLAITPCALPPSDGDAKLSARPGP